MIRVMITIDEVESLRDLCREIFGECIRDEKGEESDCPFFGPGVRAHLRSDGKKKPGVVRICRAGSTGCHDQRPKRGFDQYVYSGKVPFYRSGEGIEKDPADPVSDGDGVELDRYIFEEKSADDEDSLRRYILYKYLGRDAYTDGDN